MDLAEIVTHSRKPREAAIPAKTPVAIVQAKMPPELKSSAEEVFAALGLTPAEAIRVFYKQVELHQGLPFDLKIPAQATKSPTPPAKKPKENAIASEDIDDLGANANIDALFNNL
ncbi:MAG: type II toxin-antitoxin system RelB/DinJ family antitoxin [Phormidesmis sp. RL_2_1]|nr:type II toxin-antitoxin system RelB/DinJ family antitoxin [Phormidesmis sp. RL_2_1]